MRGRRQSARVTCSIPGREERKMEMEMQGGPWKMRAGWQSVGGGASRWYGIGSIAYGCIGVRVARRVGDNEGAVVPNSSVCPLAPSLKAYG